MTLILLGSLQKSSFHGFMFLFLPLEDTHNMYKLANSSYEHLKIKIISKCMYPAKEKSYLLPVLCLVCYGSGRYDMIRCSTQQRTHTGANLSRDTKHKDIITTSQC